MGLSALVELLVTIPSSVDSQDNCLCICDSDFHLTSIATLPCETENSE